MMKTIAYHNNWIGKSDLAQVLSIFIERRPGAIEITDLFPRDFEEGFGVNSGLRAYQIEYGTQHPGNVPASVVVKRYNPNLFRVTKAKKSSKSAYDHERRVLGFANSSLTTLENGGRLFPTCFNAGLDSGTNTTGVKQILHQLQDKRILILEELRENLDRRISDLMRQSDQLRERINESSSSIGQSLEDRCHHLEEQVSLLISKSLRTTKHFHTQAAALRTDLPVKITGPGALLKKYKAYNTIINPNVRGQTIRDLVVTYKDIVALISGKHHKTSGLVGVVHADLHHANIMLDERDRIRYTDAANVTAQGLTIAIDLAPQLFNPPVVAFHPDKVLDLIDADYIQHKGKFYDYLFLTTILAGHNWCLKGAAANEVARKQNSDEYELFLARHKNHEGAVSKYMALSHELLDYVIKNSSTLGTSTSLTDSIKRMQDLEYNMHSIAIEEGKPKLRLLE